MLFFSRPVRSWEINSSSNRSALLVTLSRAATSSNSNPTNRSIVMREQRVRVVPNARSSYGDVRGRFCTMSSMKTEREWIEGFAVRDSRAAVPRRILTSSFVWRAGNHNGVVLRIVYVDLLRICCFCAYQASNFHSRSFRSSN